VDGTLDDLDVSDDLLAAVVDRYDDRHEWSGKG
jgi:hypothetical protein